MYLLIQRLDGASEMTSLVEKIGEQNAGSFLDNFYAYWESLKQQTNQAISLLGDDEEDWGEANEDESQTPKEEVSKTKLSQMINQEGQNDFDYMDFGNEEDNQTEFIHDAMQTEIKQIQNDLIYRVVK